jgi:deferrochelatase/peroxidase EfeB
MHTVPIPYTLTARSVKASRQFIKYPAAGCIVTLFIFDDMTKNVQIAVSSLLQSTVRKPELMFIIKTE